MSETASQADDEAGDDGPMARFWAWLAASDPRLLVVLIAALYVLFTALSFMAGFQEVGRILSQLQRVTFFAVLYAMLALALNLQYGYAGLLNLGVAGFMAVGVYTMAILSSSPSATVPGLGLPLWIGIPGGFLAASLLGALAALPAIRLKADYLAIVTLAFGEITRLTIRSQRASEFTIAGRTVGTGGTDAIALPTSPVKHLLYQNPEQPAFVAADSPTVIGEPLFAAGEAVGASPAAVEGIVYTVLLAVIAGLFYWLLLRIGNSPFGRVLKAIREDELVASSLGKDTRQFKIKTFALGCGLMGLVSILWYLGQGSVTPSSFEPQVTFFVFVALILGGSGSNTGSVVGGLIFASVLLRGPQFIQRVIGANFDIPETPPDTIFDAFEGIDPFLAYFISDVSISAFRFILLGVVLIYLMQRRPDGLLGARTETAAGVDLFEREGGEKR